MSKHKLGMKQELSTNRELMKNQTIKDITVLTNEPQCHFRDKEMMINEHRVQLCTYRKLIFLDSLPNSSGLENVPCIVSLTLIYFKMVQNQQQLID